MDRPTPQMMRVLIAEDDPELRRLLVSRFNEDGYRVEEVTNGLALTSRVLEYDPRGLDLDLLITDVRMPGMTGLDVLCGMRTCGPPIRTDIPVILISAFADDETFALAHQFGAAVFEKPFDIDDLRACAATLLGRRVARPRFPGGENIQC